jgi:hypothetical protein
MGFSLGLCGVVLVRDKTSEPTYLWLHYAHKWTLEQVWAGMFLYWRLRAM